MRIKTEVNEETLEERLAVCSYNVASERRRMIYYDQDDRQSNTMMMMTLVESQDKTINHYKFVLKFHVNNNNMFSNLAYTELI